MSRFALRLAVALPALIVASTALGADWDQDIRPGFDDDWQLSGEDDTLTFETGLRYWYSWGADNWSVAGQGLSSTDNTSTGEAHFRIDDSSTQSYAKGLAGYSIVINGEYTSPTGTGDIVDGRVGYVGGDFGWNPFGTNTEAASIFPFAGYLFWNESPNMGRGNFYPVTSSADVSWTPGAPLPNLPGDSAPNNIDIHALRLGISGKFDVNPMVDISAEVAAIPFAWVNGELGALTLPESVSGGSVTVQSSPTAINGWGYGAMGELMVGFKPTDNLVFRVGGRAWYLTGNVDATFSGATIIDNGTTNPDVTTQDYISTSNPFSLFRYGALAEATWKF